jgi:hypothetical protein
MINDIVDDLDAILAKLAKNGVRIDPKREDHDYGRFASIYDLDGNKIELWGAPSPRVTQRKKSRVSFLRSNRPNPVLNSWSVKLEC